MYIQASHGHKSHLTQFKAQGLGESGFLPGESASDFQMFHSGWVRDGWVRNGL